MPKLTRITPNQIKVGDTISLYPNGSQVFKVLTVKKVEEGIYEVITPAGTSINVRDTSQVLRVD